VCQLANDDEYFASVEVLKDPKEWSRYDLEAHLIHIEGKRYLNGLSFRLAELVLFLDSIDQLNPDDFTLAWYFNNLPKRVKLIYSVIKEALGY